MKQIYTAPSAVRIQLVTEGMMAQSLQYSKTETVSDESNVLSNGKSWSSDDWTGVDED